MTIRPSMMPPMLRAATVTMGINALRGAWRTRIRRSLRPLRQNDVADVDDATVVQPQDGGGVIGCRASLHG